MSLTPREIAFVKKAWEEKTVRDSELLHKTVLLAEYNVNRGKRKYRKLWEKKKQQRVDPRAKEALFDRIKEQEEAKGQAWLDRILGRKPAWRTNTSSQHE